MLSFCILPLLTCNAPIVLYAHFLRDINSLQFRFGPDPGVHQRGSPSLMTRIFSVGDLPSILRPEPIIRELLRIPLELTGQYAFDRI